MPRAVTLVVGAATLVLAQLALTGHAEALPTWFARVRAAAWARAHAPLTGDALSTALIEARRAAAAALPQLHLRERSRLGLDASFTLELEAGVRVPVSAPDVAADRRLTDARLAATRRQLRAQRRADLHDALADAVALLATEARVGALDALADALRHAGGGGSSRATDALATTPARSRNALGTPPVRWLDVRLLAAQRNAQRRRAAALARSLSQALAVPVPEPPDAPAPRPDVTTPEDAPPRAFATEAAAATRDPLGWPAAALEPDRCALASDIVAQARLALTDARLSRALDDARARTRVDLELSGTATLGGEAQAPGYALRLGVSVALPPWSPASGAASVSVGAAGLEQSLTARWPNAAPSPAPTPPDDASVADAIRAVRRQLRLLTGQESDLLLRRGLLVDALASSPTGTLADAYQHATLALQLADVDEALGMTRLDAALLCGALPP